MARIRDEITDYLMRIQSFSRNSKIFLFSHSLTTVGTGIFTVIFNLYVLELGFSTAFLGHLISSNLVFSAVFLVPGGIISDRIGRKQTFILSTVLMLWSFVVLSVTKDQYVLFIANSARGIATSLTTVVVAPFMMEQSNSYERMHLFSVDAALKSFSTMVGNIIGGFLFALLTFFVVDVVLQYQYTLLSAGIFTICALFPLFFIKEEKRSILSHSQKPLFSGNRAFVLQFVFYGSLIGFGAGAVVPFFNVYFSQALQATPAEIGLILSAGELTMGIASLILPLVVRRFGKVGSTVLTQYVSIPFFLLILISKSLLYAFFGFFMRMTLMNMAHPAQQNFYMDQIPEHERGKASSIFYFGSTLSRAFGSDVGGFLIQTGNFSPVFSMTTILYVVATALFYIFFREREEKEVTYGAGRSTSRE